MRVLALWRYPVKSMQGESLTNADVGELGIDGDRQWAVIDGATGNALTARRVPALLMASARLSALGGVEVTLPDGRAGNDDADLSDWLGRPVRLERASAERVGTYEIEFDPEHEGGFEDGEWVSWQGPEGTFHDSARTRLHVLSSGSIGAWPVRRFRPNVFFEGAGEQEWVGRQLTIGSVRLDVSKQTDRCNMTTRPQPGGIERDVDVLRTILKQRGGNLGVGTMVVTPGRITVGDAIEVSS